MTETLNGGRLIRRNLLHMLPRSFLYALTLTFIFMIDSIVAGNLIGEEAIAAVAIGLPVYGLFLALINGINNATSMRVAWAKERGKKREFQRAYAGGITFSGSVGLAFTVLLLILARPLAMVFGGANTTEQILEYSVLYIRCCAPIVFLNAVSGGIRECIGVMGYRARRVMLGAVNIFVNLIASIVLVSLLPEDLKMLGLGIGSSIAALVELILGMVSLRKRKTHVKLKPMMLTGRQIRQTIRNGFPTSLDSVIDCAILAVANNVILMGFPEEPLILAVVVVVNNIRKFLRCAPMGMGYAASPLFRIFYAERDKNNLKRTMGEAIKTGLMATILYSAVCIPVLPLLSGLYGMEITDDIWTCAFYVMIFLPCYLVLYLLTKFYEATEHFRSALLMALIPDSILYPVLLAVLIPVMGRDGIWIAISATPLMGCLLLIPLMMILGRKNKTVSDRILRLKPQLVNRSPEFDFEIHSTEETVTGVSEKVGEFLERGRIPHRISYMASLCTEELAVEMVTHLKLRSGEAKNGGSLLDIKLFDDRESIEILIRSLGEPYNPLDLREKSDDVPKIGVIAVQKIARSVSYKYVYRMNIVSIVLSAAEA